MIVEEPLNRISGNRILLKKVEPKETTLTNVDDRRALVVAGSVLLFMIGVGIIAWDYAFLLLRPANYAWFWAGVALCFLAVLGVGIGESARMWEQVTSLAAFGAALYIPYFLRSPTRLIFADELYHYQTMRLLLEQGNTDIPLTKYPIPGEFPGLEFATTGLMSTTGLSLDVAMRVITLCFHMLLPVLAYMVARGLNLGPRTSMVAALVYMANTSYFFFHSAFSYESLGIVFVLSIWALLVRHGGEQIEKRDVATILLLLAGIAVTHHISSYLLAASLTVAWFSMRVLKRPGYKTMAWITLASIVLPVVWLLFGTERATYYLSTSITLRMQSIYRAIFEQRTPRRLFSESSLPDLERLIDFAYAPMLVLLCLAGLFIVFRRIGWRKSPVLLLALAIFGPLAWLASTPAVLTPAGELAYRSWPFLFLGVAMYGAIAITNMGKKWPNIQRVIVVVVPALLLIGGISLGDNQGGRFRTLEPTRAAGPESLTGDLVSAAQWLERTAGRWHLMTSDSNTEVAFATSGFQRANVWANWDLFLAPNPEQVAPFVRSTGTEYVVVDRRITRLQPRYQAYFGSPEVFALQQQGYDPSKGFPVALVDKFDRARSLNRIYDNGNIWIYKTRTAYLKPGVSAGGGANSP
ncbi:MAG: hypothetical protein ABI670_04995 [Chloroflexota bacterium]